MSTEARRSRRPASTLPAGTWHVPFWSAGSAPCYPSSRFCRISSVSFSLNHCGALGNGTESAWSCPQRRCRGWTLPGSGVGSASVRTRAVPGRGGPAPLQGRTHCSTCAGTRPGLPVREGRHVGTGPLSQWHEHVALAPEPSAMLSLHTAPAAPPLRVPVSAGGDSFQGQ